MQAEHDADPDKTRVTITRQTTQLEGPSPENARRLMESVSLKYEMIKLMFETK